jgi:protein-L-isoaspartate(D-aspartate) O-methyltransferase
VTAAAPRLPESRLAQLEDPGMLVAPVGDADLQHLEILRLRDGLRTVEQGCACRFVPLVGAEGFVHEG